MKKFLILLAVVLIVASIVFVPKILEVSSTIKFKNDKNKLTMNKGSNQELNNKVNQEKDSKKRRHSKDTDVTFLSLNPLEEIEWLMQNIYVEDLNENGEQAINKNITQIQWENIKFYSVTQTLKDILNGIDELLEKIPNSKVLSVTEAARLRNLLISYSSSIGFLLKQEPRNVSAKESLGIVIHSYNSLMRYLNSLQVSLQIKGSNFDFKIADIMFEKFFEDSNIKRILETNDNFLTNSNIYLKGVRIKEADNNTQTLDFDVEISGKGIKRLEVYNQYGLYESVQVNFTENKKETRVVSFNKQFSAKGIYVIKIINAEGKVNYKRYLFYPRVTLFSLENNEYKLPFLSEDYKKLDEFFAIKIIRRRINSKFFDREFITSF